MSENTWIFTPDTISICYENKPLETYQKEQYRYWTKLSTADKQMLEQLVEKHGIVTVKKQISWVIDNK